MTQQNKWPPENGLARELYDEAFAFELEYPPTDWSKLLFRASKALSEAEHLTDQRVREAYSKMHSLLLLADKQIDFWHTEECNYNAWNAPKCNCGADEAREAFQKAIEYAQTGAAGEK